jgi:hypothetical protein
MNIPRVLLPILAVLSGSVLMSFYSLSGGGQPLRDVRELPAFTQLSLSNPVRVLLRQGSPQHVEVEAAAADLSQLETNVVGSRLSISTRRGSGKLTWYQFTGPVTVYVTMPSVSALSVDGSGDLKAETSVQATLLDVAVTGSGSLQLPQVTATALETSVNGSGDVQLGGACPRHHAVLRGSGAVRAARLTTEDTQISLNGSGQAHVFATKLVQARLVGSGNVFVTGGATVSSSTMGSGQVHKE